MEKNDDDDNDTNAIDLKMKRKCPESTFECIPR